MADEGWSTWPLETGGILLGHTTDTDHVVTHMIGPGPKATHQRYTFTPDSDWQTDQVANAWEREPTVQYLGDWHTHPLGSPRFSTLDRKTAEAIAKYTDAQQPRPIMLVLALGANASTRLGAAQLEGGSLRRLHIRVHPNAN